MGSGFPQVGGKGTFSRGVHPPDQKHFAADAGIEVVPAPEKIILPFSQHIGAPCKPAVKAKDEVKVGALIGEAGGFVSAPIHASINGTVTKTIDLTLPTGRRISAVPIKADGDQPEGELLFKELTSDNWDRQAAEKHDPQAIISAINSAGIVGLGGAAFPTHVKLTPNKEKPVDVLLLNGCECEPYLTSDYRLMLEAPQAIVAGALLLLALNQII